MSEIEEDQPILITAGGTGGHVYPGLAVARALIAQEIPVIWMGTEKGLESRVIPEAGIEMAYLSVTGLRGKGVAAWLMAPFRLIKALTQSVKVMRKHRPAAVLGMGGFVAGPGGLVASLMGIPVIIHEQNAVAGLTNRLLKGFAEEVLEGFPETFADSVDAMATGNPVREDIAALAEPERRLAGREDQPFHLLVVGGSLGAKALNEIVPRALADLPNDMQVDVVHQSGEQTLKLAQKTYEATAVTGHIVPFIEDMAGAYEWADLIICRAGALTIAEVSAAGLASILVPYPYAVDDHQTENARYLAENGAAILADQADLTPETLTEVLKAMIGNPDQVLSMSKKARELSKPNATQAVAAICADYAGYVFPDVPGYVVIEDEEDVLDERKREEDV